MAMDRNVVAVAFTLALLACGNPEAACRKGVDRMEADLVGKIGVGKHKELNDPIVQAHTQLDIAQTQLATGNYSGCRASLEQARTILARSG